ncbi:MAG: hypothetical protein DHS20C20_19960 [Ardenticatenaceae bacterium]|nr:MAG: hypothetical protein DHS20C20_19960 [Ardenticatenaceae bacterium]
MTLILEKHIDQNDEIRNGKPYLVGTRMTVSDIVIMHFRQGQSLEEIAAKYDLLLASVYAAISYYFDHKSQIDSEIDQSQTFYETMKRQAPSVLREKLSSLSDD